MNYLRQIFRVIHIQFVLIRYGLDQVVLTIPWFYPIRFLAYVNPWNWSANKNKSRGERIRLALEALGPIFVKFGQVLSTRRDLLPDDIANELTKLQDKVPPFASTDVIKIVEAAYDKPLSEIFAEFDLTPLASASIAQVHTARLPDQREVVVKVLRPSIKKVIASDLSLLYTLANLVKRYWSGSKRLHPHDIVREFEQTLYDELDLMREAANASQLRRNFCNNPLLQVPEIYWNYAKTNVLVMEKISGIPVSNIDELKRQGINLKKLAERGVEIFFTQVFQDCFFHADMHPGNIFVSPHNPHDPQYIAVDFGIMGTLSPEDQRYLAENLLAFFHRDYRRVAVLHVESGWVPSWIRVDEFEASIRTVCEPAFERPLKEISFAYLVIRLFQTAKRFHMELQPQLLLLQKTLFNVEGLGRQLYPELDLWSTGKPFLEKWVKQQIGPQAFIRKTREQLPLWLEKMPDIPELMYKFLVNVNLQQQTLAKLTDNATNNTNGNQTKSHGFWFGLGFALVVVAVINFFVLDDTMMSTHVLNGLVWGFGGLGIILMGLAWMRRNFSN